MGLASINVRIGADIKGFSTAMANATRKMKKLGRNMTRTGKNLTRNLSLPLGIASGLAVKTFSDFEQGMAKVKAVSGATAAEFADLQKNAEDLGASTRFTASQVAELQLNFSKLGFTASEITKVTEATLDLSLAAGEDLARSAEIAGATLRGFDMDVEETTRVVDVMALSFSSSALDLEKFGESMKFVAPIAKATNRSIESTTALLSTMADAGISGSMAGTNLRKIFVELNDKGLTLDEALKKVAGSSNQLSTATELVGKRANTALVVLSNNQDKIADLTKEYEQAAGSASKMAEIMDDTLQGAMFKVKSAVQALGISLGRVLMPTVKKVGNFIIGMANSFKDLDDRTKKIILVIAGLVAGLGPLLTIFGLLMTSVIPGLLTAFSKLTAIIALNPFGALLIAITAVVSAILLLKDRTIEFESAAKRMERANKKVNERFAEEKATLDTLNAALKVTNKGTRERAKLIKEINDKYGDYLPNLLDEKSSNQDIAKALKSINEEVKKRIKLEVFRETLKEALTEQVKLQQERLELSRKIAAAEKQSDLAKTIKNAFSAGDSLDVLNAKHAKVLKALQDSKQPIEDLTKAYADLWKGIAGGDVTEGATGGGDTGADIKDVMSELDKSLKEVDSRAVIFGNSMSVPIEKIKLLKEAMVDLINAGADPTGDEIAELRTEVHELIGEFEKAESIDISTKALKNMEDQSKATKRSITNLKMTAAELRDAFVDAWRKIEGAVNQVMSRISSLVSASNDKALTELDNREAAEIKAAEQIVDNEDAIQAIRKKYADERSDLMAKEAQDRKDLALLEAIVSTASAVAGALASIPGPAGVALAVIVGALGAAEIATISSTPIPAFAGGGLVSAPTLAMVGDNPNASFDPEVIAPLSKLEGMFSGGNRKIELFGRIQGRDIQISNQKAVQDKSRVL
jgi:hypothetical protein